MSGKYALIIANTDYSDPTLAQLTAPGRDAEDFARVLRDKEIAAFDDVKILLNNSEPEAREAIDEFFDQKKKDDLLILYFSGHGVRDEVGSLYLALKNTTRARLRATALKSDFIREAMDQSYSKRIVLILDCCNSGAFAQGTKAIIGGSIGTSSAFGGTGYGRIVLTASDSTQFAWEGDKVIGGETQNSLFTHFLVKGLEGEADHDYDGRITVDELFDYAYEQIVTRTPNQTPSKHSDKQQGEIVLRQGTRISNTKPIFLPDELIEAIEDSRTFVREGAITQLEKLLKGKNLGLARIAREALEKMAAEDDSRRVAQIAAQALETIHQAEQLAAQKAEEERLAREMIEAEQKAETERNAREKAQRLAVQKAEEELIAREKFEAKQKAEAERRAKEEQERLDAQRIEEERTRKESEDRLLLEIEERFKREAEEIAQKQAEDRMRLEAVESAKKETKELIHKQSEEDARLKDGKKQIEEVRPDASVTQPPYATKLSSKPPWQIWVGVGAIILCVMFFGVFALLKLMFPSTSVVPEMNTPDTSAILSLGSQGGIAFHSDRDSTGQIYFVNPDGTGLLRLTDLTTQIAYWYPAWSPNGEQIAFTAYIGTNNEIYVMNLVTNEVANITNNSADDRGPSWSPDGQKIAFRSDFNGNPEIYVINVDGSGLTRVVTNFCINDTPSWSPDGNKIAYISNCDGDFEIYELDITTETTLKLTDNTYDDNHPIWSPDGMKIAFCAGTEGTFDIFIMSADGNNVTNITSDALNNQHPAWSPDGQKIAFQSNRSGNFDIYVMNIDGSNIERITTDPAYDGEPAWVGR